MGLSGIYCKPLPLPSYFCIKIFIFGHVPFVINCWLALAISVASDQTAQQSDLGHAVLLIFQSVITMMVGQTAGIAEFRSSYRIAH